MQKRKGTAAPKKTAPAKNPNKDPSLSFRVDPGLAIDCEAIRLDRAGHGEVLDKSGNLRALLLLGAQAYRADWKPRTKASAKVDTAKLKRTRGAR